MVVPISTREPKHNVNQSVATSSKKTVATDSTLVEIILFIVDSRCSKHMTGNLKLLTNFVEKFLGTVKFGNDQIAPVLAKEIYLLITRYGYIINHKKTVKNGQARTRERKSAQKPEAKPRKSQPSLTLKLEATSDEEKHTKMMGFTLHLLTQQAQVSLKRIASLAIRVRSFSDPTAHTY
ncbi:hypothetical protein Tco_0839784 [Tanacetum coccineum]|uniref:Retrovirus-related Pol polyprotein from transposon TNT 1-94-like beta-barrel domain-containing protein n=1 Tax=Tanacetum coccineum TaxID=301880 RepID=A0ABQ5AUR8_9ASTR